MTLPDPAPALVAPLRDTLSSAGLDTAGTPIAVALSGGADSAMLAVSVAGLGVNVRLFHVHHGLQDDADGWAAQVRRLAALLDLPVDVARVSVATDTGLGIEAAARAARYQALNGLAREYGVAAVLLAHHQGDQAETVLLRLLRGTGLAGMAGMAREVVKDGVRYLRPWLDVDRREILAQAERWAQATGWRAVDDPSNHDARYGRGALRTQVAPALGARWPGWRVALARHARLAAESAALLDEVAQADFAGLSPSDDARSFSLAAWRALAPAHQTLVLRYWLTRHGVAMPTEAKLAELTRQLRQLHALGHDRQMGVAHAGVQIRCVRGRVVLVVE